MTFHSLNIPTRVGRKMEGESNELKPEAQNKLSPPDTQVTASLRSDVHIGLEVTDHQRVELQAVLRKDAQCFSTELEPTKLMKHHIEINDPRRVSPVERDIIRKQVDEYLQEELIELSTSPVEG